MEDFMLHLEQIIPEKDCLKLVKKEAENYYKQHSIEECFTTGLELYQSENFQIQEVGVFLLGYAACQNINALSYLKETVSQHESWKVQESWQWPLIITVKLPDMRPRCQLLQNG